MAESRSDTPAWAKYVARQPILDAKQQLVGYELLFRSDLRNHFDGRDPDGASSSVIADSFLVIGLDALTGGKRAFLNFSRPLLLGHFAELLPPEDIVVEVLESVAPDPEVIAACRRLKAAGYWIALDDFVWSEERRPLVELADVIKVDFLALRGRERERVTQKLRPYSARLLAEKVETREDFAAGLDAGYEWFQGYFFSRPNILVGRDVRGYKPQYLRVLELVRRPDVNLREVERAILRDVSLSYKLLRFVNAAARTRGESVRSIRNALSLIGLDEVRKWVALLTLAGMAEGKPPELIRMALVRARFCELLARPLGCIEFETELFMLGLFSLIDAMLDRPLAQVLREIPLGQEVVAALRNESGPLAPAFTCVLACERGDWAALDRITTQLPRGVARIPEAYAEALEWVRESEGYVA